MVARDPDGWLYLAHRPTEGGLRRPRGSIPEAPMVLVADDTEPAALQVFGLP
jgi:hypothetical protein